jgi:N-acetylglucosamine malate deacetylase 1
MTNSVPVPRRVLAVAAHPDDIEILCAGTMARYARAGCHVVLCNATNGNRGSATLATEDIARIRRDEAEASAAVIGAEYRCLDFPDCGLDGSSLEARERFVDLVRSTKPDVVFTHHPNDYHADHVATGKLTFEATFMASVPLVSTQLPATDKILPVFYMDTLAGIRFEPEQYVDIGAVFELKREMLSKHKSQVEWMKVHDNLDLLDFMETMSKFRGIQSGVRYAEAFIPAHAWLREGTVRLLP